MAEEEVKETQEKGGGKGSMLPMILQVVTLLLVAGVLVYLKVFLPKELSALKGGNVQGKVEKAAAKGKAGKEVVVHLEPFLVNLADEGGRRYLKVTMDLLIGSEKGKKEVEDKLPEIRDRIILVLSNKSTADVLDNLGKEKLKEEIRRSLNEILTTTKVSKVLFSDFIVQ